MTTATIFILIAVLAVVIVAGLVYYYRDRLPIPLGSRTALPTFSAGQKTTLSLSALPSGVTGDFSNKTEAVVTPATTIGTKVPNQTRWSYYRGDWRLLPRYLR